MKIANLFLITALVGALAVIGCDSDTNGSAGSGGSGTAGTGGGGVMCDETAQEICDARCDVADQIPECVSFFDDCLVTDPSVNPCEKCTALALEKCGGA